MTTKFKLYGVLAKFIGNDEFYIQANTVAKSISFLVNNFHNYNIYSINESIEENISNIKGNYELVICTGLVAYISDLEKLCIYIRNISEKNTKVILQMSIKYHLLCLIYSSYMNLIRFLQKHKLRRRNFIFRIFYCLIELN